MFAIQQVELLNQGLEGRISGVPCWMFELHHTAYFNRDVSSGIQESKRSEKSSTGTFKGSSYFAYNRAING